MSTFKSLSGRVGFYWLALLPLVVVVWWAANRATAKLEDVWADDSSSGPSPLLGVVSPVIR